MDAILPAGGTDTGVAVAILVGVPTAGAVVGALVPLAEASTAESAFWGTLIAGAAAAVTWLAQQAWKYWDEKKKQAKEYRQERKEDESAVITGLRELISRLEGERREFIRELDEMQGEVRHMTAIISSAKERIVHLEEFMIASNPKYRPWTEPPAPSARYAPAPKPLPPGGPTP